jgi:DNA polymerase I-like protein with 3'-5' exonuclease and polymerase domains
LTKTLGTYVDGFAPDRKGKIYTTYTLNPSSGRLSSKNKNLQNVSHHSQNNRYAKQVRRQLIAGPGNVFVEADSSAIEAVLSGFFQGDPTYITLARQGVHDYVTCMELDLEFDPKQLGDYKKDPRYAQARERNKRVVHGTNYGMSPKMMTKQYPETFRSEYEARKAQERYLAACPRLGPWQHEVRVTAHRQNYIQNPWGYRHYFFQVFTKNLKGEFVLGPDAKRVVSFLPQSSAAAFMRDSLLILGNSEWAPYMTAMVSIHDSVCLEVPEALQAEAITWLADTLTRPVSELGGLRIGCEVKVGRNWAEMDAVHKVVITDDEEQAA